ncbi:MAG: hypothetical protein M1814_004742 [Vezdaea aestivalis]|nr:MAG: hypothetical protein M1814_004742 [Vezdaea aestivalis]
MKGLSVEKQGAPFAVVDGLDKPSPGPKQILVKSLVAGVNPVDTYQQSWGILVQSWPIVLGCDASGVVVETGAGVTKFKPGDYVCGCTRLGYVGYSTYQEFFLMDEPLTIKKPSDASTESAATVGVGVLTASLGLRGMNIPVPDPNKAVPKLDEWVLLLGGAGGVGQYAIQLCKAAGYKVIASCSKRTADAVKALGADATFDYSQSEENQLKDIIDITGGKFGKVFDAVAKSASCAFLALNKGSKLEKKYFTSTDDWTPMDPVPGISIDRISLGPIGASGDDDLKANPTINEDIADYIPKIEGMFAKGTLKPLDYELVGEGLESVIKAIELVNAGKGGGKKYVVRIQQE